MAALMPVHHRLATVERLNEHLTVTQSLVEADLHLWFRQVIQV